MNNLCAESRRFLTWDQAQFERFSYILSNGYRVSPCPPECNLQSETKIEPDLRLGVFPLEKVRQHKKFFIVDEIRRTVLKNKIWHCFKRRHSKKLCCERTSQFYICVYIQCRRRRLTDRLHLKFPFCRRKRRSRSSLFPVNRRRRRRGS